MISVIDIFVTNIFVIDTIVTNIFVIDIFVPHIRYGNNPGQQWDADSQCQLLMFTSEARMDHGAHNLHEICHSLRCRAQGLRGYYRAGPALEGTPCGADKVCNSGT